MAGHSFSEEELAAIARRAHEIESQDLQAILRDSEQAPVLAALEEAGVSRDAALQALRERLTPSSPDLIEGSLAFAAREGWYFPVRILSIKGSSAKVVYMSGMEGTLSLSDLKPFELHPGVKLHAHYYGMWCEVEVINFNAHAQTVQVNYYGTNFTIGLDSIKQKDRRNEPPMALKLRQWGERAAWAAAGAGAGGLIVFILTRIF